MAPFVFQLKPTEWMDAVLPLHVEYIDEPNYVWGAILLIVLLLLGRTIPLLTIAWLQGYVCLKGQTNNPIVTRTKKKPSGKKNV